MTTSERILSVLSIWAFVLGFVVFGGGPFSSLDLIGGAIGWTIGAVLVAIVRYTARVDAQEGR